MIFSHLSSKLAKATLSRGANPIRLREKAVTKSQTTVSVAEKPIRIAFGNQRLGAEVIWIGKQDNVRWVFHIRWCLGPINEITSIDLEEKPLPGSAVVTNYLGTVTQVVDPTLVSLIPGFTDNLVLDVGGNQRGIAHSVVTIPYSQMPDSIEFAANLKGMEVEDTRTSSTVFTTNPTLQIHELITQPIYGLNWAVDEPSFNAQANINDELVGGSRRHESHLLIEQPADLHAYLELLSDAAGCFFVYEGGLLKLVPNRAKASAQTFDLSAIAIDRSEEIIPINRNNSPNVARVRYTDTTTKPWAEATAVKKAPEVTSGQEFARDSIIQAPYLHDHRIANRLAAQQINFQRVPLFDLNWIMGDEGVRLHRGEVITLQNIPGLSANYDVLILQTELNRAQSGYFWRILSRHYDPSMYSDEVVDKSIPPGPDIDDPETPSPVLDLALSESPWLDAGGTYQTQIKLTWTGVLHAQVVSYRVRVSSAAGANVLTDFSVQSQGAESPHSATSPAVERNILYTVEIWAISSRAVPSSVASAQITPIGDALDPPATTPLSAVIEKLGQQSSGATQSAIEISWIGSSDPWVRQYRVVVVRGADLEWHMIVQHLGSGANHTVVTKDLPAGASYTVQLVAINVEGDSSDSSDLPITLVGRTALPPDIPSLEAIEYEQYVELSWPNVLGDGDISHRIKRGATTDTWSTAGQMDRTMYMNPANRAEAVIRFNDYDVETGAVKYFVKAVSYEGLESAIAAEFSINVKTAKGSRGQERPRPPVFLGVTESLYQNFAGMTLLANHLLGAVEPVLIPDDGAWHNVINLQGSKGWLQFAMLATRVISYTDGTIQLRARILIDNRVLWEMDNDLIIPAGPGYSATYVPVGAVYVNPVLEAGAANIIGMDYFHIPFNNELVVQALSAKSGNLSMTTYFGTNSVIT